MLQLQVRSRRADTSVIATSTCEFSQIPGPGKDYNSTVISVTLSKYVMSDEGLKTQRKVWAELATKLEAIQPGIMKNI